MGMSHDCCGVWEAELVSKSEAIVIIEQEYSDHCTNLL